MSKREFDSSNVLDSIPHSLEVLTQGYIDYSKEVIINRALPDMRDGLKPVNRRILYTLNGMKKLGLVKCGRVAGNTSTYHPHGEDSIYQAMVRMTDENETLNIPLIRGQGSFGKVFNTDKPAARRYTECTIHENAEDYFGEMNGVDFVPTEDATDTEPSVLPVSYPAVLTNSTSGIAVGFSSKIPAFNFGEVLDLTIEYLEEGECKTVIMPDFSTGGYYVQNNKELMKLMQGGKASLKLRGRVEIEDKQINIVEFPYEVTIQQIEQEIKDKNISGIRSVIDKDDFNNGGMLTIVCTSKRRVEEVLLALYRDTSLQKNFPANMTMIVDETPVRLGVWGVIEKWVEWRRQVLTKEYQLQLESVKEKKKYSDNFLKVIGNTEFRDKLLDVIVRQSDSDAIDLLLSEFDGTMDIDVAKWIIQRRVSQFRDGGRYVKEYESLVELEETIQGYLNDIDSLILSQLRELKNKAHKFPRRTEITNKDYDFRNVDEVGKVKDETLCTYVYDRGFLKKMRFASLVDLPASAIVLECSASDTLIGIDNKGRILRVYCENLPYCSETDVGTYLPRYFEIDDEDFKLMWLDVLDGSDKILLYNDGNVGFLDTSEWVGVQRQLKVVERGVSPHSDKLAYVGSIPDYLYVLDNEGRLGCALVKTIKRKSRTARTRVFNMRNGTSITAYACMGMEGATAVTPFDRHANKLEWLDAETSFMVDSSVFKPVIS